MVYFCDYTCMGADMKTVLLNIERHNTFAAFLRSLTKGYVLNTKLARVEVGKLFMNLN